MNFSMSKGRNKALMGVWWIGCGIYAACNVSPDFSTAGVVAAGFGCAVLILVGLVLVGTGVEKMQRGE